MAKKRKKSTGPNYQGLLTIFRELSEQHPDRVLVDQAGEVWRITDLREIAEADYRAGGERRRDVTDPSYFWGYKANGKISIARVRFDIGLHVVFHENGGPATMPPLRV